MVQSRSTPYRTHLVIPNQPLCEGWYAGRILSCNKHSDHTEILLLTSHQVVSFEVSSDLALQAGMIISLHYTKEEVTTVVEILYRSALEYIPRDSLRWQQPKTATRIQKLQQRAVLSRELRRWFDEQGFLEVQTPQLVPATNPESHFSLFHVENQYLITSPELQMKRLLVGGCEKIYQLCSCFRKEETSPLHNSEFTMLEWYRAYERLETIVHDLEQILHALGLCMCPERFPILHYQQFQIDLSQMEILTVIEAFEKYLHFSLSTEWKYEALVKEASKQNLVHSLEGAETFADVFFRLWNLIEGQLGLEKPTIIYDWPLPIASLAQKREDKEGIAERIELYIAGMEIANGFGELNQPHEQRKRFMQEQKIRERDNLPFVQQDEKFLASLEEGMPPSAGIALGVDRLVMLFTNSTHIREVLTFDDHEI